MTAAELLSNGVQLLGCKGMDTMQNIVNLRMAARMQWEREEMGGLEHVQFAYRNGTPIVPIGHCGHPLELVKRGYIDGKGWPKEVETPNIKLSKWPDGNHWYAYVDGQEVIENGNHKWNTPDEAEKAALRYLAKKTKS